MYKKNIKKVIIGALLSIPLFASSGALNALNWDPQSQDCKAISLCESVYFQKSDFLNKIISDAGAKGVSRDDVIKVWNTVHDKQLTQFKDAKPTDANYGEAIKALKATLETFEFSKIFFVNDIDVNTKAFRDSIVIPTNSNTEVNVKNPIDFSKLNQTSFEQFSKQVVEKLENNFELGSSHVKYSGGVAFMSINNLPLKFVPTYFGYLINERLDGLNNKTPQNNSMNLFSPILNELFTFTKYDVESINDFKTRISKVSSELSENIKDIAKLTTDQEKITKLKDIVNQVMKFIINEDKQGNKIANDNLPVNALKYNPSESSINVDSQKLYNDLKSSLTKKVEQGTKLLKNITNKDDIKNVNELIKALKDDIDNLKQINVSDIPKRFDLVKEIYDARSDFYLQRIQAIAKSVQPVIKKQVANVHNEIKKVTSLNNNRVSGLKTNNVVLPQVRTNQLSTSFNSGSNDLINLPASPVQKNDATKKVNLKLANLSKARPLANKLKSTLSKDKKGKFVNTSSKSQMLNDNVLAEANFIIPILATISILVLGYIFGGQFIIAAFKRRKRNT